MLIVLLLSVATDNREDSLMSRPGRGCTGVLSFERIFDEDFFILRWTIFPFKLEDVLKSSSGAKPEKV